MRWPGYHTSTERSTVAIREMIEREPQYLVGLVSKQASGKEGNHHVGLGICDIENGVLPVRRALNARRIRIHARSTARQ